MDSGIGLLPAAAAVRRLRPDADLVLSLGPRRHALGPAHPAGPHRARPGRRRGRRRAPARRADRRPATPRPCTPCPPCGPASNRSCRSSAPSRRSSPPPRAAGPIAIWATPATTGSAYQRGLIRDFADGVAVTEVPCPGLADAVEHADETAIDAAVAAAAALTPDEVTTVVLGCTHYELVAERIRAAVQRPGRAPLVLHGSAGAVAAQALRRIGAQAAPEASPDGTAHRAAERHEGPLPAPALAYAEGRLLRRGGPGAADGAAWNDGRAEQSLLQRPGARAAES